jgi:Lar family restriction alleviation protein
MSEFKQCPFCGCENMYITNDDRPKPGCGNEIYYYVNCGRCTARVVGRNTEEAIGEWNKRVRCMEC